MKKSTLIKFYQAIPGLVLLIISLLFAAQCFAGSQTTSSTLASTIIDEARVLLKDPTTYGGTQKSIWSDAGLLNFLNRGTMHIVADSHCLVDVETEILIEGQSHYALSNPFIGIEYVIFNNQKSLEPGNLFGKGDLDSFGHHAGQDIETGLGEPTMWTHHGDDVIVYPPPDATTVAEGTDKVTDGDFTESTDWTWGSGWAHDATDDEADATASDADLEQDVSAVAGETYLFAWTLKNDSGGAVLPILGGTNGTSKDANGTYSEYITATDNTKLKFNATAFTGSIDDVSVKRVADIAVYVVERPTTITATDTVLVPAQYDDALVYYIAAHGWIQDGRIDLATGLMTLCQQEIEKYRLEFNTQPGHRE